MDIFERTNSKPQHHREAWICARADLRIAGAPPGAMTRCRSAVSLPTAATQQATRRRGSVLVLVMTLLGILFVLGVTFLATMNFEADMIAGEKRRGGSDQGAATLTDGFRGALRGGFLESGGVPFGGSGDDSAGATFAELPGVQNTFSTIEPIHLPGGDGISETNDDLSPAFSSFTDASHGNGIPVPNGVLLSSTLHNGEFIPSFTPPGMQSPVNLIVCRGGVNKGLACDPDAPEDCPGSTCSGPVAADADGDGIVDSFLYDAQQVGLSADQIAKLSVQVNGAGSEKGDVFVAMRAIPHGGMANLNASHPKIIEAALGLGFDLTSADGTPNFGSLLHRPSGNPNDNGYPNRSPRSLYAPSVEEFLLRRRGLIPPRFFPPSILQGDPVLKDWEALNLPTPFGGDMANFLFWPDPASDTGFETVENGMHQFEMFSPDQTIKGKMLWAVRMDQFTAGFVGLNDSYDRRHLVTTVSHDDLLARGGMVQTDGAAASGQDVIEKMFEVNRARAESDQACPEQFPFEYVRYPHELSDAGDCCDTSNGKAPFEQCTPNIRKGRLQLSLAWIDAQLAEAKFLSNTGNSNDSARADAINQRVERVVYDAFYLMVRNAVGDDWLSRPPCGTNNNFFCEPGTVCKLPSGQTQGRCSASASYFDDVECNTPGQDNPQCDSDEFCSPINYSTDGVTRYLCSDKWTRLPRSKSRLTRTAASLTANLLDFADDDDIPTRVAIRMMDFEMGICQSGAQVGKVCSSAVDCDGQTCDTSAFVRGKSFDFDGDPGDSTAKKSLFVYGLERQPYITKIGSITKKTAMPGEPSPVTARAIELFNPYNQDIDLTGRDYFFYEVPPDGNLNSVNKVTLSGKVGSVNGPNPFTTFTSNSGEVAPNAQPLVIQPSAPFLFQPGWTIYLVRRVGSYPDENHPTQKKADLLVLDQVTIPPNSNVGKDNPQSDCTRSGLSTTCRYVRGRGVPDPATGADIWTATVPSESPVPPESPSNTEFGNWNPAGSSSVHPVEVNFANTGAFSDIAPYRRWIPNATSIPGAASFPTTGSMLLLMRHANRAITDLDGPPDFGGGQLQPITDLAFTSALSGEEAKYDLSFTDPGAGTQTIHSVAIEVQNQIDNGRMPIFDLGEAHHVPAQFTPAWMPFNPNSKQLAGSIKNLPWGQLVFDYFTAIPLDSPGPYPPCSGNSSIDCEPAGSPGAKPRVDLDGLRVHGRINLNAAPATVLRGLPFIPMEKIPDAFRSEIRTALNVTAVNSQAEPIGFDRAQAIVAYRDARRIRFGSVDTGDYGAVTDPNGTITGTQSFGWRGFSDPAPSARRGTGFMTVGELANVRHEVVPPNTRIASLATRLDGGAVDLDPNNNDKQNFVAAAAFLIALNDWATVRSHVFTIYGHIRGAENPDITDPDFSVEAALRREDVDSRAIRFQETVDRLPTFLGKALPVRIGNRTIGAYLDTSND